MKRVLFIIFFLSIIVAKNGYAVTIASIQNGEVFDGRDYSRDGVGDQLYNGISSFFNLDTHSGQAMAYFDIAPLLSLNINSAIFEWDVDHYQGPGSPSSTAVYAMLNDSALSLDDFNKGVFLGDVNSFGLTGGDILSLDITDLLQGFTGEYIGIRLASNEPNQIVSDAPFLNMSNGNARIIVNAAVVPVPTTIWLFCSGLIGLFGCRRIKSKTSKIEYPVACIN